MHSGKWMFHILMVLTLSLGILMSCHTGVETDSAAATENLQATPLPKGVDYEHRSWRDGDDGPWSVHIVSIERNRPDFAYVSSLAQTNVFGLSPVSRQVKHLSVPGKPLAAINGDFFVIKIGPYQGDPIGLHISGSELVSGSNRPAFWFDANGEPRLGEVKTNIKINLGQGDSLEAGLNRERNEGDIVLYTPVLGESTRTQGGRELDIALANPADDEPEVGESWKGAVAAVSTEGSTSLKQGHVVLSFGAKLADQYEAIKVGDSVSIQFGSQPDLTGVQTAIGGGPILIQDGNIVVGPDKVRHPRTAVGMNDKTIYWVVVDGRQPELSVGMSISELADLMFGLGCTDALNLDGGGSTTLWLAGQVMNSPSDGRERSVANALVLVQNPDYEDDLDDAVTPEK